MLQKQMEILLKNMPVTGLKTGLTKLFTMGYIYLTKPVEKDLKTQKSIIIKQKTAFIVSNNREQNSHLESRLLKIRILQLQLLKNRRKKYSSLQLLPGRKQLNLLEKKPLKLYINP